MAFHASGSATGSKRTSVKLVEEFNHVFQVDRMKILVHGKLEHLPREKPGTRQVGVASMRAGDNRGFREPHVQRQTTSRQTACHFVSAVDENRKAEWHDAVW